MAFTYIIEKSIPLATGVKMYIISWDAASATSGNIDIPNASIIPNTTITTNHTDATGLTTNDTTTAGRVALTNITSNDKGSCIVFATG